MAKKLTIFLVILGLVIAAALGVWAYFLLTEADFSSALSVAAPQGFVAEDKTRAFMMKASDYPFDKDEQAQQKYLEDCVLFAVENGFNTILFETNASGGVMFKDKFFALATDAFNPNSSEKGIDPLAYISDFCKEQSIALYAVISPFSADTALISADEAAPSTVFLNDGDYILPTDERFMALVEKSVRNLAKKYPTTGILLKTPNMGEDDKAVWQQGYTDLITALQDYKRQIGIFSNGYINGVFNFDDYKTFAQNAGLDVIFCQDDASESPFAVTQTAFSEVGIKTVTVVSKIDKLKTSTEIFLLEQQNEFSGIALLNMPKSEQEISDCRLVFSVLNPLSSAVPVFDAQINRTLKITYPTPQDEKIYSQTCFILGNSNPELPLYMGDEEIIRQTKYGSFGVLVNLDIGNNSFTFTQGDQTQTVDIRRYSYSGGGSTATRHDGTVAANGQMVRIKPWFASSLSNPSSEDNISYSISQGATALVVDSVKVKRGSTTTYAYKLQSGEYVMASRVEFVPDNGQNVFDGFNITADEYGEYIDFVGTGTPLIKPSFSKEELKLTFYNTKINLQTLPQSTFFNSCGVEQGENGETTLTFTFTQDSPLWGYQVEYTEQETTRIYLKKTPKIDLSAQKPLTGVRVMLDAGHGASDTGAPGIGGSGGKMEKDFNLAVTLATKYRLEQLGATVLLTRSDDTSVSLEDRSRMAFAEKPDVFLALHHNSINLVKDANEISRTESYYFEQRSQEFAQLLLDNISPATNREVGEAAWTYFYVNRMTVCPSVLFEYGFMVSPKEYELCSENETVWAEGFATAQAILDYIALY